MPAILVTGLQDEQLAGRGPARGSARLRSQDTQLSQSPRADRQPGDPPGEHRARPRRIAGDWPASTRPGAASSSTRSPSRKRVEQALREAEENLRLMVESIKDFAIFTVDHEAHVVSWNSGAEQLFGYSEADILGQSIAVLFPPEDRAALVPEQEIAAAAATGRATDERWHIRKDGSRFFASGVLAPIFDEDSKLRGFTKIARDITERKEAEEAVREAAVRLEGDRRHRRRRHHHHRRSTASSSR